MTAALQLQSPAPLTRADALDIFRACARTIWRNADSVPVSVSPESPSGGSDVLASVSQCGNPQRVGSFVANPSLPRTLRVSDRALSFPPEAFRKLMMHEAVHLGIGPHNAAFRSVCLRHGAPLSGGEARGEPVQVQRKIGARYRTIREFPRERIEEARAEGLALSRITGIRHRIVY
jgi:hypothetical protein